MKKPYAIAVVAVGIAAVVLVMALSGVVKMSGATKPASTAGTWSQRADEAQKGLALYWDPKQGMFDNLYPCMDLCNQTFNYWWQAHGLDTLVDAYVRTGDPAYKERMGQLLQGIVNRNAGLLPNQFYDDMEWLALANLRAYDATKDDTYKQAALTLWADIQTGWNDTMGGGIAWRKTQLGYKNTPANAPAAILAARLYQRFGDAADLEWAKKIYAWEKGHLVDPKSGFVWDGMNRGGDGLVDKSWEFTYNQGVFIGAGVELYRATKDHTYLNDAVRTAGATKERMANPATGLLPDEGGKDAGLFKGILVRYLTELVLADPTQTGVVKLLQSNGDTLWQLGKAPGKPLFGSSWGQQPDPAVELSVQLSGVMLAEQMAVLEKNGLLK